MSHTRVVIVLGGDPSDRSAAVADLLLDAGGTALVLTGHPGGVDPRLDTSENGPVEVRTDDPAARLEAYRSGAVDPDDDVLAALTTGSDAPLSAVLGWEYARRAAEAVAWDHVVVELDGVLAAVRRLAAAGELSTFIEARWPVHVRFASMAAGERADARIREAHRLSLLAGDVSAFLSGPVRLVVVGAASSRTSSLAALARGAVVPEITSDPRGGFRVRIAVPDMPTAPLTVEGERLRFELDGFRAALPMPSLLTRCVLVDSAYDGVGAVEAFFEPDRALWPPNLVPAGSADAGG